MSRTTSNTSSFLTESAPREKQTTPSPMPLELHLWIEVFILVLLGLIMVYSASSTVPFKEMAEKAQVLKSSSHYLKRQLICIGLGIAVIALVRSIPHGWYREQARWMFLLSIAALIFVLIPGIGAEFNHARRWFQLKGFSLQPAEYAKVIWVIFLSVSLVKKQDRVRKIWIGFLPHVSLCGILSLLVLLEPDFGNAFVIGCLTVLMLAAAGVPFGHLLTLAPVAGLGFYKFVYLVPYRWERVTAFRNPWTDPLDSGYQLIQAWIAVGSGGLWGKGLGASQQKLFYLPESHTDFILAVIGEELGFGGIALVCAVFFCLSWTGLHISRRAPDQLGSLIAFGLTMLLSLQALINMGVVLGLVPTKGLPLPFVSYGGSAFLASCVAVGLLMSIARSSEKSVESPYV